MMAGLTVYFLFQAFCRKVPVGVIPVGNTNKFATFFYGPEKSDVRYCIK